MNNHLPPRTSIPTFSFLVKSKQQDPIGTIAQLLDDKAAMVDWTNNIEKIRQKESAGVTNQPL